MVAAVCTVNDVLDGHVSLDLECLDRIYLNAYVPNLQVGGQVVVFLTQHLGNPIPSPAAFTKIGNAFRAAVARFAAEHQIPVVRFARDARKQEVMRSYLEQATEPGVVAIGVAQEFQSVFTGYDRAAGKPGPPSFAFAKADRRVSVYYFYVLDRDFGPGFIKLCSYFPYPAKVWVNGHEWAKRQATTAGVAFTELANGFASCDDPAALQAICDRLGPADLQRFFDRWLARIPTPLGLADQAAGYWWELSMRQIEVSRTLVLDAPRQARAFFEALVADNLDLGRPDEVKLIFGRRIRKDTPAASPPRSSPAAWRWPSTSSTGTPASSNTSRKAGRCGPRRWSTRPPTWAASAAYAISANCKPRLAPPTGGCLPSSVSARAVPLRPRCWRGSRSPRCRRANEPEPYASGILASWPWPAPCASCSTPSSASPIGACVPR
jgi:hypothetical protein